MIIRSRKQGNSIVLAVPANLNVKANLEYIPHKDANGVIYYLPKHENIFAKCDPDKISQEREKLNITDNFKPKGNENVG